MKKQSHLTEFLKYSSLNVLGMIGLSCYILADTYFVAKGLGSNGLAALNIAIPVYGFIHGSGLMLGIGGATRYSIAKSQGLEHESNKAFTHAIILGACFSILFLITGIFFAEPLSTLLGADELTFEMCKTYLRVLLIFSPAFLFNNMILSFVRNDGAPQLSMTAMLTGSFSNIIFDYIFIFPFNLGIFGAVLATGFSPIISLSIISAFFIRRKNHFKLIRCMPSVKFGAKIMFAGIPSLVTEVSSGVVIFVFNNIMLNLNGNIGVAAYGVIANISIVVIAIYTGIAQGIQPLTSKYFGMGKKEVLNKLLKYSLLSIFIISFIIYAFIFLFADPISAIFNSEYNSELQQIATNGLKIYFIGSIFAGINIILTTYFATTDYEKAGSLVSILRGFIAIISLAIFLSSFFGVNGLWWSFPLAEFIVGIVSVVILIYSLKKA